MIKDMLIYLNFQVRSVQIFKHFIVIFIQFFLSLYAQSSLESELYDKLKKNSNWGDYYLLRKDSSYHLISKKIFIDSLQFNNVKNLKNSTLNILFRPLFQSQGRSQANKIFKSIVSSYSFLSSDSQVDFARFGENGITALIDVNSQFNSSFGGLLGISKKEEKWILTGKIDLEVENFDKRGSSFLFNWNQPNKSSRFLNYELMTPFVMNFPIGIILSVKQDFLEKEFILNSFSSSVTTLGPLGKIKLGVHTDKSNDFISDKVYKSNSLLLGMIYDSRDNNLLPTFGTFLDMNFSIGFISNNNELYNIGNINTIFSKYFLFNSSSFFYHMNWNQVFIDKIDIPNQKKIRFGGANSLRGYNEKELIADWVIINTFEWSPIVMVNQIAPYLFADYPITNNSLAKMSYGIGIKNLNNNIYYNFSFSFSSILKNAKIHFTLTTLI